MKYDNLIPRFGRELAEKHNKGEKGFLVGAAIYEHPPETTIEGDISYLEELAKDWKAKGGEATLYCNQSDNFKTGSLIREIIYRSMEFAVCQNETDVEKTQEKLKQDVSEKDHSLCADMFISAKI